MLNQNRHPLIKGRRNHPLQIHNIRMSIHRFPHNLTRHRNRIPNISMSKANHNRPNRITQLSISLRFLPRLILLNPLILMLNNSKHFNLHRSRVYLSFSSSLDTSTIKLPRNIKMKRLKCRLISLTISSQISSRADQHISPLLLNQKRVTANQIKLLTRVS